MNEKEIELIDGFFNKGWCCDLDEVYKAVMKLQNNWNELKRWLEDNWQESQDIWFVKIINKMQELEQGKDEL